MKSLPPPNDEERPDARRRHGILAAERRPAADELQRVQAELGWKTAFFEAQANSSIDGIIVVDQRGKILLQNQRSADLFQIPRHIMENKDDAIQVQWVSDMTLHPEQFIAKVVYLYAHPEEISRDEIELKDGTLLDRYSSPVVGKDGTCYGRIWTFRDITEQRRVDQELKEAKVAAIHHEGAQRYNFLADTVPLILWTARPDGNLDYYNKAWFDYTGLTLAQTADWGWGAVVHPDDLPQCLERWTHSLATGEDYEIEYRFKRAADGAYRWHLGRATARRNAAGRIVQWVGTSIDIDDQKRAHSELESKVAARTRELAGSNVTLQREHTALLEARSFLRSTLDALSSHIAILDERGTIIEVNAAWDRFARDNDFMGSQRGVGDNYLQLCTTAAGQFSEEAPLVAGGIRAVMVGQRAEFSLEYPCHSPTVQRWFIVRVTRFDGDGPVRVVVAHENITERKQAETALQQSKRRLRDLIDGLGPSMFVGLMTSEGILVEANRPALAAAGLKPEDVIGKPFEETYWWTYSVEVQQQMRETIARARHGEASRYDVQIRVAENHFIDIDFSLQPVQDESGAVIFLVPSGNLITERKQAENALRESNEKFRQLAENITDVFWIASPDFKTVHYISAGYEQIWGRSMASLYAHPHQWIEAIRPEDHAGVIAAFAPIMGTESETSVEYQIVRPDGTLRWIHDRGFQVLDAAGKLVRLAGIATDITERKQLEARLLQSQKMETVGKLAGGIAHEFNSLLTAILGQSELLLADLPAGSSLAEGATEISKAAGQAAALTQQLLAYGRKQFLRPEALDLNRVVAEMQNSLSHLLGRAVEMRSIPAAGLKAVLADAGQIEQVILNLVMNARDAMPHGGKLTLETANVAFDAESLGQDPELKPGDYVMLAVSDTGTGMSAEIKARVFEPFFTTKGIGQGTGLGLSTCYGIIKQSGGHISVYSEPGRGTTFKMYLPQVAAPARPVVPPLEPPGLPRGTETILLVEDNPALREMATLLLRRLGYTVLAAANGLEALDLKTQHHGELIDLLFTDVVMPHMSGKELADHMRALDPRLKILFTSAYTENAIIHQGVLDRGVALLQKPFTPSALAHKLREVLDQPFAGPKTSGFTKPAGGENTP